MIIIYVQITNYYNSKSHEGQEEKKLTMEKKRGRDMQI